MDVYHSVAAMLSAMGYESTATATGVNVDIYPDLTARFTGTGDCDGEGWGASNLKIDAGLRSDCHDPFLITGALYKAIEQYKLYAREKASAEMLRALKVVQQDLESRERELGKPGLGGSASIRRIIRIAEGYPVAMCQHCLTEYEPKDDACHDWGYCSDKCQQLDAVAAQRGSRP